MWRENFTDFKGTPFRRIGANGDIDKIVDEVLDGKQTNVFPDKKELPMCGERVLTTPDYWAYLKIAEGCSNCCTYCAIPNPLLHLLLF